MKFLHCSTAEDAMDDPAAAELREGSDVGQLALVGVGIKTGADDVALQLTIARPKTITVITRNKSASLPALIEAI
ncbi:MAG: hypothetical protein H7270_06465 [Dermatophilaceae bacterium]|nr:hypothetical protein [Dermatophilaceae bacterium]